MAQEGWYYLHVNGDLIFKRELGGTAADIRDSDFSRALWPADPTDRAGAWRILIEGAAAGARPERIQELAKLWQCDEDDADVFAERVGCKLLRDGNMWMAARQDFVNIQESPCAFAETKFEAMVVLAKELGYRPTKMWGHTFQSLLEVRAASAPEETLTFERLEAKYGKYTKDGCDYVITQDPYPDRVAGNSTPYVVQGETYYFAQGYDREGNQVRLIWEITNTETEDESEACNWDSFKVEPRGSDVDA